MNSPLSAAPLTVFIHILLTKKQNIIKYNYSGNIEGLLFNLDSLQKEFIHSFSGMCSQIFISESRAKQLVEILYPEVLKYRDQLSWCEYLAFLLKHYLFVSIDKIVKHINSIHDLRHVLSHYGLIPYTFSKKLQLQFKNSDIYYDLRQGQTSKLQLTFIPSRAFDSGFLFNNINYRGLRNATYKEYLWFKNKGIKFEEELAFDIIMNSNRKIFDHMVNTGNYHILNTFTGNENLFNVRFYEENTDYEKFKTIISFPETKPYNLYGNEKYVVNLYPFLERLAKEEKIPLKDMFNLNDENIFKHYAIIKFFLDRKLITLQGKKSSIDKQVSGFHDGPIKLIVYDNYIPAKTAIKKYNQAYQYDPLWPQAKAKLLNILK